MSRGVIASSAIFTDIDGTGFTIERQISSEEIKYYALYWDKIAIPCNNFVYLEVPDEKDLMEVGILQRPVVTHQNGLFAGKNFLDEQIKTANKLIGSESGEDWVLHQIGDKLFLPPSETQMMRTLRFNLINTLPVPLTTTPIADILEFKLRRSDELQRLHASIEAAYLAALSSPDLHLSGSQAVEELKKTIHDINTVSSERWAHTRKFDYSVTFNLDGGKLLSGIAAGVAISSFTNIAAIPLSAALGALASTVKISAGIAGSLNCAADKSVLAYLSNAQKENIIAKN